MYNYIKPQNYFGSLFIFFGILSLIMGFAINSFEISNLGLFFAEVFAILFLIILISVIIEFFRLGEYMAPFEVIKIEHFYKTFITDVSSPKFVIDEYVNKYDVMTKQRFFKIFVNSAKFELSSIRKKNEIYEIDFIRMHKGFNFFLIRFLLKIGVYRMYVRKSGKDLKIIRLT